MRLKSYKVSESQIWEWWSSVNGGIIIKWFPQDVIQDIKTGNRVWLWKGIPIKLK